MSEIDDRLARLDEAIANANRALRIAEAFLFFELGILAAVIVALVIR